MEIIMGKRLSSCELTECPNPIPAVQFSTSEIQSFLTVSNVPTPLIDLLPTICLDAVTSSRTSKSAI
jgi:hypothetical protein